MNVGDIKMKNTLLGLVLLLCDTVLALNECGRCNCCINGTSRCEYNNNEDGVCLDGCIDGYFTDSCIHACSNNCVACYGVSSCYTCKNGYYIGRNATSNQNKDDCSLSCSENCISCTSYYNCSICNDGYYNGRQYPSSDVVAYNCQHKCRDNCKTCTSYDVCTECKNGFKGDLCDRCEIGKYGCVNSCSIGCENKKCTYTGECPRCKEGFTGVKCDRCINGKFGNLCEQNCPLTCLACSSLTNCSACIGKHWGNSCQQCPTNCLNCSSNSTCSSCEKGFNGQICNKQCNVNCLDGHCDQLSENCNDGCVAGFYGNFCDMKCGNDCVNLTCDRVHGNCLQGCKAGHNAINSAAGNEDTKGVIIGAAVGGCILLIIIVVLVAAVVILTRRLKRLENSNTALGSNKDLSYYNVNKAFVGANTDTGTRPADVNQPTTVYESLTTAGVNRFADYSSLQLQDVPTSELANDHTFQLDPGVQYYNVSAK